MRHLWRGGRVCRRRKRQHVLMDDVLDYLSVPDSSSITMHGKLKDTRAEYHGTQVHKRWRRTIAMRLSGRPEASRRHQHARASVTNGSATIWSAHGTTKARRQLSGTSASRLLVPPTHRNVPRRFRPFLEQQKVVMSSLKRRAGAHPICMTGRDVGEHHAATGTFRVFDCARTRRPACSQPDGFIRTKRGRVHEISRPGNISTVSSLSNRQRAIDISKSSTPRTYEKAIEMRRALSTRAKAWCSSANTVHQKSVRAARPLKSSSTQHQPSVKRRPHDSTSTKCRR